VSAEIVWLHPEDDKTAREIDLATAVDVAIRDLHEIDVRWGTSTGLQRLRECRELLVQAFTNPAWPDGRAEPKTD
jgi:hypothetical protein